MTTPCKPPDTPRLTRYGTAQTAYVGNDPGNFVDPLGLEAVRAPGDGEEPEESIPNPIWPTESHRITWTQGDT
ncbi:MAG: hypothetical protein ACOCVC_09035, partial [Spirochaeta sp.]